MFPVSHCPNHVFFVCFFAYAAPCQPPRPNATVSCTDNVVNVRWMNSAGGQLYTVNAVGMNGTFIDSCNGFDGSCDLRGLVCGLQYTATVVAQHSSCLSLPSPPTLIKTGEKSPSMPPDPLVKLAQDIHGNESVFFISLTTT